MCARQFEADWAARVGAREARLVAAPHVPAALSLLGIMRPGDRLVAFADDFVDGFASGFDGCDVALVGSGSADAFTAASEGFDASVCVCPICALWAELLVRPTRCLWWITPWRQLLAAIRCGWVLRCRSRRSIAYAPVMLRASWLPYRSRARSSSAIAWMPRPSARMPCLRAVAWPSLN